MPDFKPDIRPPAGPHRERPAVFARSPWADGADAFGRADEVPTRQWMGAVGRRVLTPAEQDARREYFDRKAAPYCRRTG